MSSGHFSGTLWRTECDSATDTILVILGEVKDLSKEEFDMNEERMKITDMTKGNPVRLIMAFALPILIGNIFQQVYSIVDTMVAGYNLGGDAIAAIGATSSLYQLIIELASGSFRHWDFWGPV